jgi:dipeptidyl aminopeptidase/acylaminoacyl peptidase
MRVRPSIAGRALPRRFAWLAFALALALAPMTLTGQAPAAVPAAASARPGQGPAAKDAAPQSWADKILSQETYATPPPELAAAVTSPRWQNASLSSISPDKKWYLNQIGDGPVPMATFSKPFHELGGVFIDFKANRARALTIGTNVGIQLVSATDGTRKALATPPNSRISNATWSPDGSAVAYFVHTDDATHVWLTDLATNAPRRVTPKPVLATLVSSFDFTKDGRQIAVVLVPDNRPPMPVEPPAPAGPQVKVHDARDRNRLRTFPSLMSTPYELSLLEWHSTGQLTLVDVRASAPADPKAKVVKMTPAAGVKKVGRPAMIRSLDVSPDGKYIRVARMTRPFSYIVPVSSFGSIEEVWDVEGKALAKIADRPLNLGTADQTAADPSEPPSPGGQQGKREIAWREDGQGLSYLEQEPAPEGAAGGGGRGARAGGGGRGGDQAAGGRGQTPQRRDRLYQWLAPFEEKGAKVLFENPTRMNGLRYSPDMQTIFFRETSGSGSAATTVEVSVNLAEPTQRYTLARFRNDDPAANPGTLVGARPGAGGQRGGGQRGGGGGGQVLMSPDKSSVYYQGTLNDKNPEQVGPKTFIDRVAIRTGEKKRLFESDNKDVYESVTTVIDPEAGRLVVERQSPTDVPQFFHVDGSSRRQLTDNKDLFPDLTNAPKKRVMVERADGIKFPVYVMLPPGYKDGTRLPAIFWFYPREFDNQEAIDRPDRGFNRNTFQAFGTRSMQFFARLGYAVVVDSGGGNSQAGIPIVGPNGQENNNYVNDLRNSLAAVIDELDRRAIVDRSRLAIGGHSYGAFTTVNAMVHTPFFKAGIAGDGAYNRTLTPIGFQSERRDLWEAPNVYLGMSPFLYANNLTGALLMYHGMHDQNVGTDPDNSIRLFHALNGLGKTAALYMYPLEDHGPASRETLLDLWARWAAWLDKYVKNPQKGEGGK